MVDEVLFASGSTEHVTPEYVCRSVIEALALNFDAAATHENAKLPYYATKEGIFRRNFSTPAHVERESHDGLSVPWTGKRVWLNPPYSRGREGTEAWVRKAAIECSTILRRCLVAAVLLPARTETDWFQRWVFPYAEVHFIMSRISFEGHDAKDGEIVCGHSPSDPIHPLKSNAPFPSVIAVYSPLLRIRPGQVLARTWDPRTGDFESGVGLSQHLY